VRHSTAVEEKLMNESQAFCPQCKNEVAFVREAGVSRCPVCGFHYQLSSAPPVIPSERARGAVTVLGLFLRVILILAAVVLVGLGVLFVGCAMMIGRV
jgi:hypothetical protein